MDYKKLFLSGLLAFKLNFALTKHWSTLFSNRCMYAVIMSVMG